MLDRSTEYGRHATERLERDLIGWLATVRPNGQPDVVPVWFLWQNDEILIYSRANKQKLSNITRKLRVALVVDDTNGGGDVVRVEGRASIVDGHPPAIDVPAFIAKYAAAIERIGYTPEGFARDYPAAIRITPTKIGR
jgi:PPOX class probable F420-dependent enzyme